MAPVDLGTGAERLFVDFMAPLVLGGDVRPGRPIGGRAALALGQDRTVADADRHAHVQLARIRVARRLVPVDRLPDATVEEWALAACLHDLVQSTHPGLEGLFSGGAAEKLTAIALETIRRIAKPRTVGEALSRHTWFARMFEIVRRDTTVSWWIGSRTFLGTPPAPHLMTWPDLRRVRIKKMESALADLPARGEQDNGIDKLAFSRSLAVFLHQTPLTDLCTVHRAAPLFAWSPAALELVATRAGRTLVARALRAMPEPLVSAALGRATRPLVAAEAWRELLTAMMLLGHLTLTSAQRAVLHGESPPPASHEDIDASFARTAGALAAREQMALEGHTMPSAERAALEAYLRPLCEGPLGRDLSGALSPYRHFFPSFFANAAFSGASSKTSILE